MNVVGSQPEQRTSWPGELQLLYADRRLGLTKFAYLICGNREVAEELVQDAFVAVADRWETVEYPRSYVRTVVANRCRDWLRRQATERRGTPDPSTTYSLMEPDEMWDAIGRLDERRRVAVVLRFYEDLPDKEIAEVLQCNVATVRSMIFRAIEQLRAEVKR